MVVTPRAPGDPAAIPLGDRSSASPLPAGRPKRHAVGSAGSIAFPSVGNYVMLDAVDAQLGPFNLPYRFWLTCIVNNLFYSGVDWQRYDIAIYLLVNGAYSGDLNGQIFHETADSSAVNMYNGQSAEAKFYCEKNVDYYVRNISKSTVSNLVYYQHPAHMNMYAYTVGEGVYY